MLKVYHKKSENFKINVDKEINLALFFILHKKIHSVKDSCVDQSMRHPTKVGDFKRCAKIVRDITENNFSHEVPHFYDCEHLKVKTRCTRVSVLSKISRLQMQKGFGMIP